MSKKILLVQPDFPIPKKRKIPHESVPIGLLKIGTYLRDCEGHEIELVKGNVIPSTVPEEIWITSLFTYWSKYVHDSSEYYSKLFPNAVIIIGGIYASLLPDEVTRSTKVDRVHVGLHAEAEEWCRNHGIDYGLLDSKIDFQILHGMRGCFRRCKFCGTWKIEPQETFYSDVDKKIIKNHVIFYDNNFLRNPQIKEILTRLAEIRINNKKVFFESQSGFDGRILDQEIAVMLKKANFINPRIAWDNSLNDFRSIASQIDMLVNAGFKNKDIYVFIIYNWDHDYEEVERKRLKCWEYGVQISDCRYRPLNQLFDNYSSRKVQDSCNYYIHPLWSDRLIRFYRANVRKHNICVRHGFNYYSKTLEHMKIERNEYKKLNKMNKEELRKIIDDIWFPDEYHGL